MYAVNILLAVNTGPEEHLKYIKHVKIVSEYDQEIP